MMTETPPQARKLDRLRLLLASLDHHAVRLLPLYLALYLAAIVPLARRPLWFDELFTYYLAMSKSSSEFFGRVFHVDLNPPLSYFLAALSLHMFGDSPFAVRLPFVAAFFLASLAVFIMVRKRLGGLLGLSAMMLVWSCGYFSFAAQARPYALLLAFFAFAFLHWTNLRPTTGYTFDHGMLSGSLGLMLLSHCFAVFLVPPFFVGEFIRTIRAKRLDRGAWIALIAPMLLLLTYIPLFGRAESTLFPAAFLPSLPRAGLFYSGLLLSLGPIVWIPWLGVVIARPPAGSRFRLLPGEIGFLLTTLLMPLLIMGYLGYAHVAYWPRYGIGAVISFSIFTIFLLAWKTNQRLIASGVACLLTLLGFCIQTLPTLASYWRPQPVLSTDYLRLHADLPFVTASGLTFLEMDHRESPEFVHRLFYLTDKAAAIKYAHATMFEGLPSVAKYFPVRATVMPYQNFLQAHPRFLVFATPQFPEDWLLDKLKDDGADIQKLAEMKTSYRDTVLYEVQFAHPLN